MLDHEAVLSVSLPAQPQAASAARRALAALNGDLHLVSAARLADAQLLVSELVTNAVRHSAAESVKVDAYADPQMLRVVVSNAGPAFELGAPRTRAGQGAGGWGLRIVQAVAHRCGVEDRGGCVRAWFEVDRPQRGTALEIAAPALPPPAL